MLTKKYLKSSVRAIREYENEDGERVLEDLWTKAKGNQLKFADSLLQFWVTQFPKNQYVHLNHMTHGWMLEVYPLTRYIKTHPLGAGGVQLLIGDDLAEAVVYWTGIYLLESTLDPVKNGIEQTW